MKTHGILSDSKRFCETKEEIDWISAVSGLRAEQRVFDQIQQHLSDDPCLLINGLDQSLVLGLSEFQSEIDILLFHKVRKNW